MKNIYDEITSKMDLSGLQSMTWDEIKAFDGMTKRDLAKTCIPGDITFDYALPIQFVDAMKDFFQDRFDYRAFIGTSFALYSDDRNINCLIWSACQEQNDMIIEIINRP